MRSGFLLNLREMAIRFPHVSQSLLNEVWFPTTEAVVDIAKKKKKSQSLLNEVWFPTFKWRRYNI